MGMMRTVRQTILGYSFLLYALLAPRGAAAQDVQVQAVVSETTIGAEEVLSYTLDVQGVSFSDVEPPQPPEADGLVLQSTVPSTQRNITFVNGALSQSIAYQWSYRPARTGSATLAPITVTIQVCGITGLPGVERRGTRGTRG